jgi:hypothetical protein
MKSFLFIVILSSVLSVSCARQLKDMNIDMTSKGTVGATLIVEDDSTYEKYKVDTLFFKRIESETDFTKGTIVMSKVQDSDGNIVINAEPGFYVIIAAKYPYSGMWAISAFDDKIMKFSLVEIKAGETKILPKIYTIAKFGNILGMPSEDQKTHADIIANKYGYTMHKYVFGSLNMTRHPDKDAQKKAEEKQQEKAKPIEEFK